MPAKENGLSLEKLLMELRSLPEAARKDVEENYEEYRRIIEIMARKYERSRVERDDLIQEAMLGLVLACRDFDPKRSSNFRNYAIVRMKGKMYEYCIGNENPIYVPTHVAKAGSYVKQMQRLLAREAPFAEQHNLIAEVIAITRHEKEELLNEDAGHKLRELKRKLGNIANNSKTSYEKLAGLAMESLSMIVSDDILSKFPKETEIVEDLVSNKELAQQIKDALGEKKFTVLSMKANGWSLREIAEQLEKLGYTNIKGERITRQAVRAIWKDTIKDVREMKLVKNLKK